MARAKKPKPSIVERWTKFGNEKLLGRTIVEVRYMTDDEASGLGWFHRPVIMQLDDGSLVWCGCDDEGNDGGALHGQSPQGAALTFPLLSKGDK